MTAVHPAGARSPIVAAPSAVPKKNPRPCDIRVVRDGSVVWAAQAAEGAVVLRDPGAYRVECRLDGRPWVFSNHLHVGKPGPGPAEGRQFLSAEC